MNHRYKKKLSTLLIITCLIFTTGTSLAYSTNTNETLDINAESTAADPESVVSHSVSRVELKGAREYWTEEKMLMAKELPAPTVDQAEVGTQAQLADYEYGPFEYIPGGLPKTSSDLLSADEQLEAIYSEPASETLLTPLGYSYPAPFTRYTVNQNWKMWKQYPYKTVGKFYFHIPGSGDYFCSGAVAVGRAVWTTGHCIYSRGIGWHTNMVFVPAYKDGKKPWGNWYVFNAATLGGWINNENVAYDIGMVAVNDKSGYMISDRTGYLGAMFNAGANQHFHAFGYPANISNARFSVLCAASTAARDPILGPDPIGIGCDMGAGVSGGPWIVKFTPYTSGAVNFVNGIFSYYYTSQPKQPYSPFFGTGAKNLYIWGQGQ